MCYKQEEDKQVWRFALIGIEWACSKCNRPQEMWYWETQKTHGMQCGAAQDYRHKTALHGASGKNRAAESADDHVCARYEKLDRKLFRTIKSGTWKGTRSMQRKC